MENDTAELYRITRPVGHGTPPLYRTTRLADNNTAESYRITRPVKMGTPELCRNELTQVNPLTAMVGYLLTSVPFSSEK